MKNKYIVAIDLGGTNLKIGLFDLKYSLISKKVIPTTDFRKRQDLISAIVFSVTDIIKRHGLVKSDIAGLGVGLPGPVDADKGIVHFLPNIPGWKNVPLKSMLRKKLGLEVCIDNDAKLMALAEYKKGSAKGSVNAVCMTLGTGVGSGIIIGGELYRGFNNAAGEIGHLPVNENGPRCNCKSSGCLEAYIGNARILQDARKYFKKISSLEELSELANKGNKKAADIWLKAGMHLGNALVGLINVLNPDCIVIGGGVACAGKLLFDTVHEIITKKAMHVQAKHVKIKRALLGQDAGLIGAAIIVGGTER